MILGRARLRILLVVTSVLITEQAFADFSVKTDQTRIVGGTAASIESFPYQIALVYDGQFACGGSILDTRTILTAAHCIKTTAPNAYSIKAGSTYLSQITPLTQTRVVSRVIVHPQYNSVTDHNDIAILKLSEPLLFSSAVHAIALPPAGYEPVVGSAARASGWGATSEGGSSPDGLRMVILPVVSQATCRRVHGPDIINSQFCAGIAGKDTCQGDSGGPLASQAPITGTRMVIGVTSFGIGCGRNGYPGVFTKVSAYRQWILSAGGVPN